jgi:hypothetical protein
MESAKVTARKSGANLVLLTEVKQPSSLGSSCYRITAKMYRNLDQESLSAFVEARDLSNASRLPEGADYAVVYFYRPKIFTGSAVGYKVRLNDDTVIGRVRNGEKFEYKTTVFGEHTFWGKTEARDSIVINVEKGEEYFVRCGIKTGAAVGRPEMVLMPNHVGIKEYEKVE